MWTGSSAVVRVGDRRGGGLRVEVQRARVDVGEDRARALVEADVGARDERERRRDDLVAVLHPGRAQREVQPGGAARDGAGVRRRRCAAAKACSKAGTRGPSESWPDAQDLGDGRGLLVAEHRPRERDLLAPARGRRARRRLRELRGRGAAGRRPGLLGVLERVDERLPGRGDDVLGDADRAPDVLAVGGVDQHARRRLRAVRLVEDPDLEVHELDVGQVRVDSVIAARSALSSALTGPLPSAVRT